MKKKGKVTLAGKATVFRLPAFSHQLCRDAYCTLLGITKNTLTRHKTNAPSAVERSEGHLNSNQSSHNALSREERQEVIDFVLLQADEFAIPNPRYTFSRTSDDPVLREDSVEIFLHFPAHLTKASLYHRFSNYCLDSPDRDGRIISESSFRRILKESDQLAHIRWDNHGTGACATCKSLRYSLYNSRSDERVLESGEALKVHIRQALDLRQKMKEVIEIAQTEWNLDRLLFPVRLALACISFDYASGLKLP